MWYIFFGAWFLRGAGVAYSFVTIALTLILSVAFFYESDGRGWKNFATLIILCSAPRLIFTPIYTIASVQTSSVNGTHVPDYHEAFHNLGMRGFKDLHNDITIIWFIYYYSFMLFMMSIQRVTCRKTVEKKKQKIYSENLKIEETRRTENEQTVGGPMYI